MMLIMITVRPHTLVLTGGESYLVPKLSEYTSNICLSSRSPGDVPPPNVGMMPSFDEILHKSNLIPFGEVRVDNHPPTPPVPMTLPMVYLVPVSKDEVGSNIKYLIKKIYVSLFHRFPARSNTKCCFRGRVTTSRVSSFPRSSLCSPRP